MGKRAISQKWWGVSFFNWSFNRKENTESFFHKEILHIFHEKCESIEEVGFGTFHEMKISDHFFLPKISF